uniref:Uncharacterized protein n=1 Tax=Ditylenchus dipsaci TaxID=166011 RepID=A0A915ETT5_9BILA
MLTVWKKSYIALCRIYNVDRHIRLKLNSGLELSLHFAEDSSRTDLVDVHQIIDENYVAVLSDLSKQLPSSYRLHAENSKLAIIVSNHETTFDVAYTADKPTFIALSSASRESVVFVEHCQPVYLMLHPGSIPDYVLYMAQMKQIMSTESSSDTLIVKYKCGDDKISAVHLQQFFGFFDHQVVMHAMKDKKYVISRRSHKEVVILDFPLVNIETNIMREKKEIFSTPYKLAFFSKNESWTDGIDLRGIERLFIADASKSSDMVVLKTQNELLLYNNKIQKVLRLGNFSRLYPIDVQFKNDIQSTEELFDEAIDLNTFVTENEHILISAYVKTNQLSAIKIEENADFFLQGVDKISAFFMTEPLQNVTAIEKRLIFSYGNQTFQVHGWILIQNIGQFLYLITLFWISHCFHCKIWTISREKLSRCSAKEAEDHTCCLVMKKLISRLIR